MLGSADSLGFRTVTYFYRRSSTVVYIRRPYGFRSIRIPSLRLPEVAIGSRSTITKWLIGSPRSSKPLVTLATGTDTLSVVVVHRSTVKNFAYICVVGRIVRVCAQEHQVITLGHRASRVCSQRERLMSPTTPVYDATVKLTLPSLLVVVEFYRATAPTSLTQETKDDHTYPNSRL
jgi:hypothetical protein